MSRYPDYSTPLKVFETGVIEGGEYGEYFEVVSPTCGFAVFWSSPDDSYFIQESTNELWGKLYVL